MVDVRPFAGLRFDPARFADLGPLLSPPYDVIGADERAALLARSPYNIVRAELPDAAAGEPYAEAARTLATWRSEGVLVEDETPAFWLYEVDFEAGGQSYLRRSLAAAVRLEPWDAGQVLPHERTMAAPREDRLRLLRATRTNISPIWLLWHGGAAAVVRAWDRAGAVPPEASFGLDDGTRHRLWKLADPELAAAIQSEFADRRLVVADGHHRYETALQYRDELAAAGRLLPEHEANFVLAHLVADDDPGLVVFPTHRLVRDLGDLDQAKLETETGLNWHAEYYPIWAEVPPEQLKAFLEQLAGQGETERAIGQYGPDPSIFAILLLRNKQLLDELAPDRSAAWRQLDVALLDEGYLKPLLERAGADRAHAVAYERDPYAAIQAVRRGDYQLALFLNPTRPEQVTAVAEAGDRMPEKSTYFYPKLPTGLVMRTIGR